jgi:hypothetical protein
MDIVIASWHHDFKFLIPRTRPVSAAEDFIAQHEHVSPAHVFIHNPAGTAFLDPSRTFLEQGVEPDQRLHFVIRTDLALCLHKQAPAFHCQQCGRRLCLAAACLHEHTHYPVL